MTEKKTCFVVQGFGEKTDLATGRALNLDASYEVLKEAIEAAGLRCIRADEIVHSGTIDGTEAIESGRPWWSRRRLVPRH